MGEDDKVSQFALLEKVVTLDGKVSAAHTRLDKMEVLVRDDLKEIKEELKLVVAWMNRGKGWAAASLLISSIIGGAIVSIMGLILKK